MEMFEWYLIRATGTVAYVLLYATVMIGLYTQFQKKRKQKVAIPLYLHEVLSNWTLILVCGHIGITLFDSYMSLNWIEVLVPFTTNYETIPMALGIIGTYFLILTMVTSWARKVIGYQKWRKLHALNPILYMLVTLHGILMGTDFQGMAIALVNGLPIIVMAIFLQKDRLRSVL